MELRRERGPPQSSSSLPSDGARAKLHRMREAIGAAKSALKRDACGDWSLRGTSGHIFCWGPGRSYGVYVRGRSGQHWAWARRALAFCTVTQDGDAEGCLRLPDIPTRKQGAALRKAVGILTRRKVSVATIEHLKQIGFTRTQEGGSVALGSAKRAGPVGG